MDRQKILLFTEFKHIVELYPLAEKGIIKERERELESIFSFGNGYIGTRNSLEESYPESTPGSFIAGMYTQKPDDEFNFLVRCPDWTSIRVYVDDNLLNLRETRTLHHVRYIDFERGIIVREWQNADKAGRITNIKIIKYISLANKNELGKIIALKPVNYTGSVLVTTGIDCNTADFGHLLNMNSEVSDFASIQMMTKYAQGNHGNSKESYPCPAPCFGFLQRSNLFTFCGEEERETYHKRSIRNLYDGSFEDFTWKAELGNTYIIKSLCLAASSDGDKDPIMVALSRFSEKNKEMNTDFFDKSYIDHCDRWKERFDESRAMISGCEYDQRVTDFAVFHLITSGEFSGNKWSIPARNLSGEAYRGHVFWDTEMFLTPFFTFTKPEIARGLLMYRYNTLNGARGNAFKDGFKGASYAWESTDTGTETAPSMVILPTGEVVYILSGKYENHISSDIAYAIRKYWQATGDDEFMADYGAEIVFETARFCTSILTAGDDGLYHINDIIGPDEYHERVHDNAYTNYLVKNNLDVAVEVYEWMKSACSDKLATLCERIWLQEEEINDWGRMREKIYSGYDLATKLFEQFKGYYGLEYVKLADFEPRSAPMDIILGRERTAQTQVAKQADVLMFMMLFGERFSKEELAANFDYYEDRCGHGSSLSPSIHCITAARAGKTQKAYEYFQKNAHIDLGDIFGNSAGGIHIAALGGVWLSVVFGFAGMYAVDRGLIFDPQLPDGWNTLNFPIKWRGQSLNVTMSEDKIEFLLTGSSSIFVSAGFDNWKEILPEINYTARRFEQQNQHGVCWKWREEP